MKVHVHSLTAEGTDGTEEVQRLPQKPRKQSSCATEQFLKCFKQPFNFLYLQCCSSQHQILNT